MCKPVFLHKSISTFAIIGEHPGGGVCDIAALPVPVGHPEITYHLSLPRIDLLKKLPYSRFSLVKGCP